MTKRPGTAIVPLGRLIVALNKCAPFGTFEFPVNTIELVVVVQFAFGQVRVGGTCQVMVAFKSGC